MNGLRARLASIDILRGAIIVLMAIDHVRVYAGVPAGGPTFGVFFTRWITNFSAPGFVFLAGTGAFLYGAKSPGRKELSRFLALRGVWLIVLELTVLRFAWTFNFDYSHYMLAGVIWMLGWCMILMAGVVWLPLPAIAAFGLVIVAGHNFIGHLLSLTGPALQRSDLVWLWQVLYFGGQIGNGPLIVLYSLLPWIGVMACGYAFGAVMRMEPQRRHRITYQLGAVAVLAFVVLRGFNLYGDPRPWRTHPAVANPASGANAAPAPAPQPSAASSAPPRRVATSRPSMPAVFRFLNTNKYPASLLFLLMTLGPMLLVLPSLERARGVVADALNVFGRVPLFFYLLHIPLIHALALVVSWIREGAVNPWLFTNHPMANPNPPDGYTWSLPLLYLMWLVAVAMLYPLCWWYARLKASHRATWLSYL